MGKFAENLNLGKRVLPPGNFEMLGNVKIVIITNDFMPKYQAVASW